MESNNLTPNTMTDDEINTSTTSQAAERSLIDNVDEYQDREVRKVITDGDLWKCAIRGLFMEGNFNFERMQGGGWAFSIIPALKKIHTNKADLAKSLKNHLQFFNASPKLFTFLLGTAIAMEENKEKPSTINVMKVAGMGPTGGIGDAIDHMTLMPLTLALGASIALGPTSPGVPVTPENFHGSIAGPFIFFFLYQIVHFIVYFGLMFMGYRAGTAAMVNMGEATEKLAKAANIMGIFVIGALCATFIRLHTTATITLGGKTVELQTAFFDKILPNMLPLALVFLMLKLVKGKGFWAKPPVLIFSTLAAGVVGHYLGIL